VIGGVLAAFAGALAAPGINATKKRQKRKKRKKRQPQARPNEFGCLAVNDPCTSQDQCCSGICEGTGKTSHCAAHNELDCDADDETCSESVRCGTEGVCYRTTGKAGFCGNVGLCNCLPCKKDSDCEATFGPGAACTVCTDDCAGVNGSQGTACVPAAA
jgi:hypothetical protein